MSPDGSGRHGDEKKQLRCYQWPDGFYKRNGAGANSRT